LSGRGSRQYCRCGEEGLTGARAGGRMFPFPPLCTARKGEGVTPPSPLLPPPHPSPLWDLFVLRFGDGSRRARDHRKGRTTSVTSPYCEKCSCSLSAIVNSRGGGGGGTLSKKTSPEGERARGKNKKRPHPRSSPKRGPPGTACTRDCVCVVDVRVARDGGGGAEGKAGVSACIGCLGCWEPFLLVFPPSRELTPRPQPAPPPATQHPPDAASRRAPAALATCWRRPRGRLLSRPLQEQKSWVREGRAPRDGEKESVDRDREPARACGELGESRVRRNALLSLCT